MAERNYNIALTATDGFSGAFAHLKRELGGAEGAALKLQGALRSLGALGAVAGVGFFAGMLQETIKAGAELNNLAKTTSLTVEQLSTIADVARESGTSLEQITGAIVKFQRTLDDARGGVKDAALAFRLLGIDASDGTLKTANGLDLVATRLLQMEDGVLKNNVAMQMFGRTGAELNEFLSDYATRSERAARITSEMAADNERLERGWRALKNSISDAWTALGQWIARQAGALQQINARDELDQVLERQRALRDEIERLQDPSRLGVYEKIYAPERLERARAALARLNVQQIEINKQLGIISFAAADADQNSRKLFQGIVLETAPAAAGAKTVSGYFDEMVRIGKELDDELRAGAAFWAALAKAQEEAAAAAGKYASAQASAREQDDLAREANIRAVVDQVNALEREVEQLGLSNDERARSALLLALENSGLDVNSEAYLELAARIEKATRAKIDFASNQDALRLNADAAKHAADEWQRTADSIRDSLTDALLRGFESGKDFAKNLRDTLVNMFKTLVLRPIIQGVLAPVSNGLGGLFGGFGGSPAGNILGGGLGGLFSGFEGLPGFVGPLQPGTFGAGLSSFFQGASSPLSTFGTLFGGGGLDAIGGIGGLLGAALPIVGIGAALASAFGLFDRGGPKAGGAASSLADVLGGTVGLGTLERLFTPNQRDSDVQKVTDSIATSFLSVARSLGIAGGTAQFGLGFDTDPEGDAGNRVSALATLNGQTVYQVTDRDLGRDGDVTAALEEEAKRALFAALQASEMPAYLANLFDGIDAAGATAEQIDGILQTAAALKIAVDAISGLGDQFAALDPADVQGFVEAFGGLEGLLQRVAYIGENFYTDAERLAQATTRLEESFDALGIAVPQTHQAFLALLNGLDLTTAEGREMYEAISALAPLFVEVRGTAQQAADALEDAAGALDDVAQAASNIIDLGSLSGTVYGEANSAIARIIDLAGMLGGSIGEQLTAQINLANGEIQRYIALWQQAQPGSAESQALLEIIGILQQFNQGTAAALAQYTSIVAQYGAGFADAIYQLQQQYWQQTQLFQGNTQALSELAQWYNEQLQIILSGTEDGVTGTISELDRLRESLQDYLAGLSLRSDLSPLSPAARLAEAQRQYQDLLSRAQGGDVDALRDLQGAADAYLRIAREMFASGADYTNIFQSVVDALSVLSAPPQTGGPEPRPDALIAAALPEDSRLASQADIEEVQELLRRLIAETRAAGAATADATVRGAERVAVASRPLR